MKPPFDTAYLDALAQSFHTPEAEAGFYARSARGRRLYFVQHAFPKLKAGLPEGAWAALRDRFLSRHAGGHYAWMRNALELRASVAELVEQEVLHPSVAEHVAHYAQLQDTAPTYRRGAWAPGPEAPTLSDGAGRTYRLNPTFVVQSYAYDVTKPLEAGVLPQAETTIGYFAHADSMKRHWLRLTPSRAALLRAAAERVDFDALVAHSGAPAEAVQALIEQEQGRGWWLRS